jgi:Tol biopolymer transport system component
MNGPNEEPFRILGVGGPPVFSPDNKWMAFTKAVKPDESAPATPLPDADRLIDERFKGRKYDWMNARFDGRGYLADPRDPHATPPEEVFIVSREGGEARQLTTLGVNARGIAWRPDSSALAFVADTHQRDEYSYDRADLFTISLSRSRGSPTMATITRRRPGALREMRSSRCGSRA